MPPSPPERPASPACSPWLMALALAAVTLAAADARAEQGEGPQIVSITSDPLPGRDPVAISGLTQGAPLTRDAARRAVRELWNTGEVSDVRVLSRPAEGGVAVRIALQLNQVVRGLTVTYASDDGPLERQEVAQALGYYAGMPWRSQDLERMIAQLEETLTNRGYPSAEVDGEVRPAEDNPGVVTLTVTIAQGAPVRLSEINLTGRLGLDEEVLREELEIEGGDVYDQVRIDEGVARMLERLREEGYYEADIPQERITALIHQAGSDPGAARLIIPVSSGDHYRVTFAGNRYFRDDELLPLLEIEHETNLSQAILDTLANRLRDHFRSLGFYFARVDWQITEPEPDRRRLTFRIRHGPRVRVREIRFEGNEHFDDRHLRRQIEGEFQDALGESGLFRPVSDEVVSDIGVTGEGHRQSWRPRHHLNRRLRIRPREVFLENVYRDALAHIGALYGADGFLQVEMSEPQLEFSDERRQLTITIAVDEGPQTMIQSISFAGNAALQDSTIQDDLDIQVGDPLDRYEVEQARRRVISTYQRQGYMFVAVETDEYLAEDMLSVDIRYDVHEGPQVRVGEIIVRGNETTRTSMIIDRTGLRPGDIYSPQVASQAERALIDLGIFSTVSVTQASPDEPSVLKDVVVELAERRPQSLEARLGFSTADGPRGELRYGYNNLFGYALGVELRVRLSYQVFFLGTPEFEQFVTDLQLVDRLERLVVASLRVPHIPRIGRALSMRLDVTHERNNDPAYAVTSYGTNVSFSSGYKPYFTTQLQTGFNFSDIVQVQDLPSCGSEEVEEPDEGVNCLWVTPRRATFGRAPQGAAWFWVTRLLASVDFRDSPFSPSRGFFGSASAEHVYSLNAVQVTDERDPDDPDDDVTRQLQSNLIKFSLTLNGYIPLGFLDWVLALQVRFGWVFELVPDSHTFADRYFFLGGFDSMRGFPEESMRAEDIDEPGGNSMLNMRAELRIPLVSGFALGVFFDTGNLWREQVNLVREFDLRMCLGAGIRFNTPVGPLALDGAFVLDRRDGEDIGAIQFAIGLF